jgi:long-chain acyl-CoA synthetase
VVETDDHAEKVAIARAGLPALAHVWQIDGSRVGGLADIKARGVRVTAEQVKERRRTCGADDLAEFVYTSGTTGRPKGLHAQPRQHRGWPHCGQDYSVTEHRPVG